MLFIPYCLASDCKNKCLYYIFLLFQYLGRWYQQETYATLTDLSGKCWSQLYRRKERENPYDLELTIDYTSSM